MEGPPLAAATAKPDATAEDVIAAAHAQAALLGSQYAGGEAEGMSATKSLMNDLSPADEPQQAPDGLSLGPVTDAIAAANLAYAAAAAHAYENDHEPPSAIMAADYQGQFEEPEYRPTEYDEEGQPIEATPLVQFVDGLGIAPLLQQALGGDDLEALTQGMDEVELREKLNSVGLSGLAGPILEKRGY